MSKKVYLGNKIYGSIKDCASDIGYDSDIVERWLSKTHKPPMWIVEKGFGFLGEHPITEGYKRQPPHKEVICEGIEYPNGKSCALHYKINPSTMTKWLSGINPMPPEWKNKGLKYKDNIFCFK